jgi:DNA-binding PadR family transcriptional regulator
VEDKILLLGILRRQKMHGYQLYEYIDQGLSACSDLKKPTAYYLLNKMAQDGWLSEETSQEGNRPPRKVYRMTAEGEEVFQRLLRENLASYITPAFPNEIGLAFLDELDPQEALELLQERRTSLSALRAAAQAAPVHQGSLQLVLDHQTHFLSSELVWLDRVIESLQTTLSRR